MENQFKVIDMVDLAIKPENGVVNFCILHALLKIITNKLAMETALVEFKDSTCTGLGLKLDQLQDNSANFKNQAKTIVTQFGKGELKESDSEYVLCQVEKNESNQYGFVISDTKPIDTTVATTSQELIEKTLLSENTKIISTKSENLTMETVSKKINANETTHKDTSKTISVDIETNTKKNESENFSFNFNKRLEAVEIEISKVSAAVNGLTRDFNTFTNTVAPFVDGGEIDAIRERIDNLERQCCKDEVLEPQTVSNDHIQQTKGKRT